MSLAAAAHAAKSLSEKGHPPAARAHAQKLSSRAPRGIRFALATRHSPLATRLLFTASRNASRGSRTFL